MTYVRLLWLSMRLSTLNELAYRTNFLVQAFESLLGLGTALGGLALVFAHTHTLGGWRPAELLAVLGVYFLVGGAINLVIQPSMQELIDHVWMGTLDFVLTKPEDAQLLVSAQEVQI
jgi:ABC-2 type transport system permease protein